MGFETDTSLNGILVVTEENITRYYIGNNEEVSKGLLVKTHYKEIRAVFFIAGILKNGKTYESISAFYHEDKDLEKAPHMIECLDPLEHQLNLMTDGDYDAVVEIVKAEERDHDAFWKHKYAIELQDIYYHIADLRDGRYYETESIRYKGRRGIPRITTVGERIYDELVDLVWRMDNGLPNRYEEKAEKAQAFPAPDVFPDIEWPEQ